MKVEYYKVNGRFNMNLTSLIELIQLPPLIAYE